MKNRKLPLTIIILTHRDDWRFKKCLTSAQFAKEVIVEKHATITDFAEARNKALKKTSYPWVLFLDSDEIITQKSQKTIKKVLDSGKLSGAWVKRTDIFHNKKLRWGEIGNTWLLRLVNKKTTNFVRPVHEKAIVKGVVKKMPITIKHFAHLSIEDFIQSITEYSRMEAEFRLEKIHKNFKKNRLLAEMITFPLGKFLVNYLFRFGFLDGWRGLVYATVMSLHSLMVRIFLYELS